MIDVSQLAYRYRPDVPALDDVTFQVGPGEIYCLLGATGSGKTTLLNILLGGLVPSRGHATIAGINVTKAPRQTRDHTTFIRAGAPLYDSMTARQNVDFFLRMGTGRRPGASDIENALRRASVPERFFDQRARELPSHAGNLLWLAIAALRNTPALVVDDPTAGIDPSASEDVRDCLEALARSGKAVLVTTSDVVLATRVADRIGILQRGQKTAEHSRSELLDQSLTQFLIDYGGRRAASMNNLLSAGRED